MRNWSLGFLMVAIVAALFGFGVIASGAETIVRVCFYFSVTALGASLLWELAASRHPAPPL